MQVLEREFISTDWTTILIIVLLILLLILKKINGKRLNFYSKSFFNSSLLDEILEEYFSFFSFFNILLFLFSTLTFSLGVYLLVNFFGDTELNGFFDFSELFLIILSYVSFFLLIDFGLIKVFSISNYIKRFLLIKLSYFYNISIWLLPFIIIHAYTIDTQYFLLIYIIFLFLIDFFMLFYTNKKLIINKLFYFILYICTLKIAPLLIVYKLTN